MVESSGDRCTWTVRTSPRARRPGRVALCTLIWVLAPVVGVTAAEALQRVKYRVFDRTEEGVAEVRYEKDRIALRLFNESIADYYVLYMEHEDLLESSPIPRVECDAIAKQREALRNERQEQRRIEKERRAEERARRKAEEARKKKTTRGSRRSSQKSSRTSRSRRGRMDLPTERSQEDIVPMTPEDPEEVLESLGDQIDPLVDGVARQQRVLRELRQEIQGILAHDHPPRQARVLRGRIEEHVTEVGRLQKYVDRRRQDFDRLRTQYDTSSMKPDELVERAEGLYRQIAATEKKLLRIEKKLAATAKSLASLPAPRAKVAVASDQETSRRRPSRRRSDPPATAHTVVVSTAKPVAKEEPPAEPKGPRPVDDDPVDEDDDEFIGAAPVGSGGGMSGTTFFLVAIGFVLAGVMGFLVRRPGSALPAGSTAS